MAYSVFSRKNEASGKQLYAIRLSKAMEWEAGLT